MKREHLKEHIKGLIREIMAEEENSTSFKIPSLYNQFNTSTPSFKNKDFLDADAIIKRINDKDSQNPDYLGLNKKPRLKTYSNDWKGNLKQNVDSFKDDIDKIKNTKTYKTAEYLKNVYDDKQIKIPLGIGSWKDPSKRKGTLSIGDIRNRIKGGDLHDDPIYGIGIDLDIG